MLLLIFLFLIKYSIDNNNINRRKKETRLHTQGIIKRLLFPLKKFYRYLLLY